MIFDLVNLTLFKIPESSQGKGGEPLRTTGILIESAIEVWVIYIHVLTLPGIYLS